MDSAGHIASAAAIAHGQFHQFNDASFLGLVQNLFYPPLEDFIVAAIRKTIWILDDNFEGFLVSFKIYLSFLFAAFLYSIWAISQFQKNISLRFFFLLVVLYLINSLPVSDLNFLDLFSNSYEMYVGGQTNN